MDPDRHLYRCPSCDEETWHAFSPLGEDRWTLTCSCCNLTSLLTEGQFSTHELLIYEWNEELGPEE